MIPTAPPSLSDAPPTLERKITGMSLPAGPAPVDTAEKVEIIDVTPELAKQWLENHPLNRRLRMPVVNKYARAMRKGHWRFNGEPIQFDNRGHLINGQHRLNAIIQAGTTQRMLVVSNLPHDAHETMDAGAIRKPGDVLVLSGYKQGTTLATVARLALQIEANPTTPFSTRNWSTAEIKARVERDQLMLDVVDHYVPSLPKPVFALIPRGVLGYAFYRLAQLNTEAAETFFTKLGTLANLDADSPILALHRRLNVHSQQAKSTQYAFETLAYVFMAWNAWRKGEPRTMIKLSHSDGRVKLVQPV